MTWWTTRVKQKTADPPLWKHTHIKALSTSPKEQLLPSAETQKLPHLSQVLTKNFNIRHGMLFPLLPCANLPHFREHIIVSRGSATAESEGKQHFKACSVSSLHVPLSAVNNHVGLTVLYNHSHQSMGKKPECFSELDVAKLSPFVFLPSLKAYLG